MVTEGLFWSPYLHLITLMYTKKQMVRDDQLLDTARDYFQFATNFFEVIDVSATHLYHSALELSPLSSIVRKLYYYQRPHPSPRVVIGISDIWNPSTVVPTKHSYYLSSAWSPCGRSVAVVAEATVEILDALTLELVSTLQSPKVTTRFRHGLAYSPDGYSLSGCSNAGIVIWDAQTGGVIKEIEHKITSDGLELAWSSDGSMISTISPHVKETLAVHICNVASGATRSPGTLQSRDNPYLWAHNKFFRVMTTAVDQKGRTINIFEVGSTITRIESFTLQPHYTLKTFSPATYRISVSVTRGHSNNAGLLVLDIHNSRVLLQETEAHWSPAAFSPDGSLFAAFSGNYLVVWKYASGNYSQWRGVQQAPVALKFSPTSPSILCCAGVIHVLHLDNTPAALTKGSVVTAHNKVLDAFSPNGSYIATAHFHQSTVMITNLHPQNPSPSQFIDTEMEISAMVLTGNVLLVKGSDTIVAWLLTEGGVVDGIFGNTRADCNDSLWAITPQDKNPGLWARLQQRQSRNYNDDRYLGFSVRDETAEVRYNGHVIHIFHTRTGEILRPANVPQYLERTWYRFYNPHQDECDLYHHDLCKSSEVPNCDWVVSQTALHDGWVKDPEGKHCLWLHAHWRSAGNDFDWFDNVTTMRLRNSSELVIIKF